MSIVIASLIGFLIGLFISGTFINFMENGEMKPFNTVGKILFFPFGLGLLFGKILLIKVN